MRRYRRTLRRAKKEQRWAESRGLDYRPRSSGERILEQAETRLRRAQANYDAMVFQCKIDRRNELEALCPSLPEANDGADEVARQIAIDLMGNPELTIADIRAAIDRRFGPP